MCYLLTTERLLSQAHTPTGSLLGTVFCTDTGTPCRFASVDLIPAHHTSITTINDEANSLTSATDINGHYELHGIPAGDYIVNARIPGYISESALAHTSEARIPANGEPITASLDRVAIVATKTSSMNVNMIRAGSISGMVTYDDGGAAIDLPVQILRRTPRGEWAVFVTNNGNGPRAMLDSLMSTDDRGRYHFANLPPGHYTVRATLPRVSDLVSGLLNTSGDSLGRLSVFLEGQYQANDQSSVELTGGEDLTGENIIIPTQNLWRLSGAVDIDSASPQEAHGSISLLDSSGANVLRSTRLEDGGAFTFENVVSGSYRLSVDSSCAKPNEILTIADVPIATAISVQNDITDLELHCTVTQK